MYTADVARISIRQIAAAYTPREWSSIEVVRVELDGRTVLVRTVRLEDRRTKGGYRRFLVCPSCSSPRQQTIALAGEKWGCRRCFKWRSRARHLAEALDDPIPEQQPQGEP